MESGEVFIEVNSEEIQTGHARFQGVGILLYAIMIVLGSLESEASCLFVAPSVSWYKQDRDPFNLLRRQIHNRVWEDCIISHRWVFIEPSFPM